MSDEKPVISTSILGCLNAMLPDLETIYKDIHSHPELSMQETWTAGVAADHLRAAGYEVTTGVGKTGVVGLLRNGDGPTVMLRADMDALPIKEATGLPYASTATGTDSSGKTVPIAHSCGHDMHVTWLIRCRHSFCEVAGCVEWDAGGRISTSRGDGTGVAGHDRRRAFQAIPEA
jgi:metal-dependent amidase/aminoacylase/carboxypeptidase family protein